MSKLSDLPNIGAVNAKKLEACGVDSPETLVAIGSKEALLRMRMQVDPGACLSTLYGLEGAIQGLRWHALSMETKEDLKAFFDAL